MRFFLTIVASAAVLILAAHSATAADATGLPLADGFETDLSKWPGSAPNIRITSDRAASGTQSAAGSRVSGSNDNRWLNRAWGDARNACTSCFGCDASDECPGGHTPEVWIGLDVYPEWTGGTTPTDRKILTLAMFEDWNSNHGTNTSHSITYISLLFGDFDRDGRVDDISWNSPRRHDASGNPIPDVWQGTPATGVFGMNQWHDVVLRARVNTPGQSNGVLQLWVDGARVIDRANVNYSGGYAGGQTWNMLVLTDNGDGPAAPHTLRLFWDDVRIDTTPIVGGTPPTAAPASPILLP